MARKLAQLSAKGKLLAENGFEPKPRKKKSEERCKDAAYPRLGQKTSMKSLRGSRQRCRIKTYQSSWLEGQSELDSAWTWQRVNNPTTCVPKGPRQVSFLFCVGGRRRPSAMPTHANRGEGRPRRQTSPRNGTWPLPRQDYTLRLKTDRGQKTKQMER